MHLKPVWPAREYEVDLLCFSEQNLYPVVRIVALITSRGHSVRALRTALGEVPPDKLGRREHQAAAGTAVPGTLEMSVLMAEGHHLSQQVRCAVAR